MSAYLKINGFERGPMNFGEAASPHLGRRPYWIDVTSYSLGAENQADVVSSYSSVQRHNVPITVTRSQSGSSPTIFKHATLPSLNGIDIAGLIDPFRQGNKGGGAGKGPGGGTGDHGKPIVVTREVDAASPLLWQALCTNESLSSVVLDFGVPQMGRRGLVLGNAAIRSIVLENRAGRAQHRIEFGYEVAVRV